MAIDDRSAQIDALRARVKRLLGGAGIRLSDLNVARGEVSAGISITNAHGACDRGEVRVGRRPKFDGVDMWHANMGDPDCLDVAELIELTLRGLGFTVERDNAVPNVVSFHAPADESERAA